MTDTSKPRDDFTVQVIRTVDDGHAIYHLKIPMLGDGLIQRGAALERFLNRPCTPWGGRGNSARTDAGGLMRASSMDLRERVLLDSDAGMKAADVAAKYRVSGSWVRLLNHRQHHQSASAGRPGTARRARPRPRPLRALADQHVARRGAGHGADRTGGLRRRDRWRELPRLHRTDPGADPISERNREGLGPDARPARRGRWASHGSTARRTTSGASSRWACPRPPSSRSRACPGPPSIAS